MDGKKEDRHRVHAKELKKRQKHKPSADDERPEVLPQQPLPDEPLPFQPGSDIDEDVGLDFRDLTAKNASGGRAFAFKTEKEWDKDVKLASGFEHLFEVDVQLLAKGIATIPFHQRFNLDDIPLSIDLVEKYNLLAAETQKEFAKEFPTAKKPEPIRLASALTPPVKKPEIPILPKLPLHLQSPAPKSSASEENLTTKEDIQNWLDDVLDI